VHFAICNELFGDGDLDRSLAVIKETGFDGVELAPHTIFGDYSGDMRPGVAAIRRAMANEDLAFVGLHWLLVGPSDLHVTSPHDTVWRRSWDHVARLIDLAGELGGGTLVFGSPSQRASKGLLPRPQALTRFTDGLLTVADRAEGANSRILLEALASSNTDIMNTLEEVRRILIELQHPALQTVFDFHNVEDETSAWPELITAYADVFTHVHLNELDGGAPTLDSTCLEDFRAAFAALKGTRYDKWVSLEIFTVPEDPAAVLRNVRAFLADVTA
jgi:D-psicose/D-tagatose/L-ribulose 3-epimerase